MFTRWAGRTPCANVRTDRAPAHVPRAFRQQLSNQHSLIWSRLGPDRDRRRRRTYLASQPKDRYCLKWQGPGHHPGPLRYALFRVALATLPKPDKRRGLDGEPPPVRPIVHRFARSVHRIGAETVRALIIHPTGGFTPRCDRGTFASVGGVLTLLTPHQAGICPASMPRRVSGQASEGLWPGFPRADSDHHPFLSTPIARKRASGGAGCPARLLFPPSPGGGGIVCSGNGWTASMNDRLTFPARPGHRTAGPGIVRATPHDARPSGGRVAR